MVIAVVVLIVPIAETMAAEYDFLVLRGQALLKTFWEAR
jgi:hypothetical protein